MKKDTKQKAILGIVLLIVIILCAVYVQLNNTNTANKYNDININSEQLNIFFFNVGQADSSLIMYNGKTILIDAGNISDGKEILKFLNAKGIQQIDYLIGTHIHEDHIGGIIDIVNNIQVEKIFMPYNEKDNSEFYNKVKKAIKSKDLLIETLKETDELSLGENLVFKILYVDNTEPTKANNASIVAQLTYAKQKYLFMGDAEKEVENKLISKGLLEDVDVLKVGHHGSDTSTTENFINKVLPEISIISVQEGVKYEDMPNENVINRLKDKSKIYRTDIDGTIWITSDGTTNIITTLKDFDLNGADKLGLRVYLRYALFKYHET